MFRTSFRPFGSHGHAYWYPVKHGATIRKFGVNGKQLVSYLPNGNSQLNFPEIFGKWYTFYQRFDHATCPRHFPFAIGRHILARLLSADLKHIRFLETICANSSRVGEPKCLYEKLTLSRLTRLPTCRGETTRPPKLSRLPLRVRDSHLNGWLNFSIFFSIFRDHINGPLLCSQSYNRFITVILCENMADSALSRNIPWRLFQTAQNNFVLEAKSFFKLRNPSFWDHRKMRRKYAQ